ncbi:vacuolar protein sorting-associated protein 26b [Lynx pardinus]|uniref:Vacuolar protein sorting-associated protein 26b n=1 Tax=Lynx pardinus TaxID=191816 RepID=A0A485PI68_LYNPA|nr:vacuolar protein sorting-associated protein 26b [Lynx pardinus]
MSTKGKAGRPFYHCTCAVSTPSGSRVVKATEAEASACALCLQRVRAGDCAPLCTSARSCRSTSVRCTSRGQGWLSVLLSAAPHPVGGCGHARQGSALPPSNCIDRPRPSLPPAARAHWTLASSGALPGGEMSFFGFGQSVEVEILLNDAESRKRAEHKTEDGKKEKYFLFYDGETVSGKVSLALKNPNKRLEHQGIKIEFIGQILYYDRGNHHEFVSLVKDLARPGEISQSQAFDFEFTHVEKPYESYTGQNVKLRYFLRATISRRLNDVVKEMDIVVHTLSTYPELNSSIKMEVGIEDCLHIEFEYNKSKYHLKDVIVGKIYFLLVRIKIKHMEIDIIKRETTGTGPNVYHENDTIAKYEIMDGAPVRGESIPIRLFLAGYELTPTMRDINKKFSVRYYLNLVLIDEEERRYFKQQEVVLWRKGDIVRKSMSHQAAIASQRFEGTTSLGEVRTPSQLSDNNSRQ